MAGQVIEFPRKLEWKPAHAWYGRVSGTQLYAKVEEDLNGNGYNWAAWNGPMLVAAGNVPNPGTLHDAQEAAKGAMEKNVVVVRPLEGNGK